jgi:hypothetical protein
MYQATEVPILYLSFWNVVSGLHTLGMFVIFTHNIFTQNMWVPYL